MEKLPALTKDDLAPWFNKLEMIVSCAAQVKKDLAAYGLEIQFSGNAYTAYEELFQQLEPFIGSLSGGMLNEVLYRVDVQEEKVQQVLLADEPYSKALTRLILWRELQKVVTRHIISGKG